MNWTLWCQLETMKYKPQLSWLCNTYFRSIYNCLSDPPTVTVTYKRVKQTIQLQCKPRGEPDNYTFDEWEHRSEFNELIRRIKGTPQGILAIKQSKSRHHEDDGVYVCRAANGIPNSNDTIYQEGRVVIESSGYYMFLKANLLLGLLCKCTRQVNICGNWIHVLHAYYHKHKFYYRKGGFIVRQLRIHIYQNRAISHQLQKIHNSMYHLY